MLVSTKFKPSPVVREFLIDIEDKTFNKPVTNKIHLKMQILILKLKNLKMFYYNEG